jgi:hypothetical protein
MFGGLMGKLIDLMGQRFGFWVVQSRAPNNKSGQVQWICECECGSKKLVTANSLRSGNSTSCGCNHAPDLVGEVFGELKVLSLYSSDDKTRRRWLCQCSCGKTIVVSTYKLREKITKSCGCKLYESAENSIMTGRRLAKRGESAVKRGMYLIEEHTKIMAAFNEEMQKGMELIAESRKIQEMKIPVIDAILPIVPLIPIVK